MKNEAEEPAHAGPTWIRDVVARAKAKLASLQARKDHIQRRMRSLRTLASYSGGVRTSSGQSDRNLGDPDSFQVVVSNQEVAVGVSQAPAFPRPSSKLRRACRIALMESDESQSSAEILARIRKRGSYSFQVDQTPLQTLAAELDAMAGDGEVLCAEMGNEKRWAWRRE